MPKTFDNEYFKLKNRERRQKNPLLQKSYVYVVKINDKKYAVLQKTQLNLQRLTIKEYQNRNDIIQCF